MRRLKDLSERRKELEKKKKNKGKARERGFPDQKVAGRKGKSPGALASGNDGGIVRGEPEGKEAENSARE